MLYACLWYSPWVWAVVTGIPDVEYPNTASRNPAAVDQHTIINDYKGYDKFYFLGEVQAGQTLGDCLPIILPASIV